MRTVEIALKLLFLGISIYFISTQEVLSPSFNLLLLVSIMLGLILMLNQDKPSYKFKHTKKDYLLRRIEGGILVIFAAITSGIGL